MNQSAKYRQTTSECNEVVQMLPHPCTKAKMLAIAQSWILLAALAERNSHLNAATTGPIRALGERCRPDKSGMKCRVAVRKMQKIAQPHTSFSLYDGEIKH